MIVQVNSTKATIRFSVNHTLLLLLLPSFSPSLCHWLNERLIKSSGIYPWQNRAKHDINFVSEIVDCRSLTYCCAHTMGQPPCYRNRFLSSLSFFFLFSSANWLWRRSFAIPRTSHTHDETSEKQVSVAICFQRKIYWKKSFRFLNGVRNAVDAMTYNLNSLLFTCSPSLSLAKLLFAQHAKRAYISFHHVLYDVRISFFSPPKFCIH